jgi:FHS family L-fucose permease-like MFS transporter
MHFYKPRWVFGVFLTMCIVFLAPSITQRGNTGMSMLFVTLFFESICFPTIVALGMRGLGRHTKKGSGFIIGGVIGGACVPPLLGVAADARGTGFAMVVPLCFFVAAWSYPICVNFVPSYRNCADAFTAVDVGIRPQEVTADVEKGSQRTTERVLEGQ